MGLCESQEVKDQKEINRRIDKELKKTSSTLKQKLLLLGPGESGKSTTLKQMQILHASGFSEGKVEEMRVVITYNTIQNMIVLLDNMDTLGINLHDPRLRDQAGYLRKYVNETNDETRKITLEVKTAIKTLWADKGIQKCFEERAKFQFADSAVHFFEEIDRIAASGYRPTPQDILFCRTATTGVVQVNFVIKSIDFDELRVYDVGGQRSERRKWIHCFDDVNALIFVVAVSEYDQTLREDNKTNRLTEALELYDGIIASKFFEKSSIILFLNKKDLFEVKIKKVSLNVCFPNYKGGLNYADGIKHVRKEFKKLSRDKEDKNGNNKKKQIYFHETCATDTNQVTVVINSVIDVIIQENLKDTGMI
ncbi:hypothetical protein PRIPAC_72998 [Pristionchus pacificus]|uniref:ADP ribosylation factor n=1 Tax=Pristionchus pacificus TaxID=54126 RepID=A0A2A6CRE6_PRIPA|nr:hypothetical protein PRIPAC_72998 [Pristionchus pacificus]|eukprot:PDM80775.1 ADP ribosylation factor [Pristionchus pacificus]